MDVANNIKDILTMNCTSQNTPKAYILGGQPGAGKTRIMSIINESLLGNVVVISGDNFRKSHPNYCHLQEKYGDKYVEKISVFSKKITEYLIHKCSDLRLNLIIEGTLRTAEVPLKTEKLLKAKGYETELSVMAVNPKLSYLGTLTRYERMLDVGTEARETTKEHHDKVVNSIASNIKDILETDKFNSIKLYNRHGTCIYNKNSSQLDVQDILIEEYIRLLTKTEVNECKEQLRTVLENMQKRMTKESVKLKTFTKKFL